MIQPKRYNFSARIVHIPGGDKEATLQVHHEEGGLFVYHADYAALQAEVERLEKDVWRMKVFKGIDEDAIATLKAALNTVPEWAKVLESIENNARLETENIALQAENERLRRLGDAMAGVLGLPINKTQEEALNDAWTAAKGVQS